jgi:hypothetical protein
MLEDRPLLKKAIELTFAHTRCRFCPFPDLYQTLILLHVLDVFLLCMFLLGGMDLLIDHRGCYNQPLDPREDIQHWWKKSHRWCLWIQILWLGIVSYKHISTSMVSYKHLSLYNIWSLLSKDA